MRKKFVGLAALAMLLGLMPTVSYGQLDGLYEFDAGGDGTSWDDAANWAEITDPNGNPLGGGDPATPPAPVTSADVPLLGLLIVDGTQAGQTALDVSIGTVNGGGSLTLTGGDLTTRDIFVGRDAGGINIGLLAMSGGDLVVGDDLTLGAGSVGIMTMSGGTASTNDDFNINANSSLTMTGGELNVGDRINTSDNAGLIVDGGSIVADDDFFFFDNSQVTLNSGLLETKDKLRFDSDESFSGKLTINGGIARSNEFGIEIDGLLSDFRGEVEINGDGVFQVELGDGVNNPISQLTLATANALIAEGVHLTTSESDPLAAKLVVVPEFFGRTNVTFVEIAVIPEPASLMLLGLGSIAIVLGRRK